MLSVFTVYHPIIHCPFYCRANLIIWTESQLDFSIFVYWINFVRILFCIIIFFFQYVIHMLKINTVEVFYVFVNIAKLLWGFAHQQKVKNKTLFLIHIRSSQSNSWMLHYQKIFLASVRSMGNRRITVMVLDGTPNKKASQAGCSYLIFLVICF